MREITRSVKIALKCLIAVGLPYCTSKVEHLIAFEAIVSQISLRVRRNGYLGTSGKRFGDMAIFYVDFFPFYKLKVRCFLLPVYFTYCAKFEVDMAIHRQVIAFWC